MAVKSLAQQSLNQSFSTNSMLSGYDSNYFHHLETVRLGGSAASVTFSNLQRYSDYQHLQLRLVTRDTRAASAAVLHARFNGDTASNYAVHRLIGTGSSVTSANLSGNLFWLGLSPSNSGASGNFAATVCDILDPFETNKNTTIRSFNGFGGSVEFGIFSGAWLNTAAVSSILIFPQSDNFTSGSRFSLYGIKARS